ncbi:MAG: 4Fe-4S binding protein [Firmicutes bacterium]|nr:4Fe-4S binding protein [Bacillota bacterium]
MIRKIIEIDEEKCNGCGICAEACHEGAICVIDGKAKLMREDYCDGLGDCLPACPESAISFVEREAAAYDEKAANENKAKKQKGGSFQSSRHVLAENEKNDFDEAGFEIKSRLLQWPVQIKLVPVKADFFEGANLLVAADCTAFAYGDFHRKFIENKTTVIGCPKLDAVDYSQKLGDILRENDVKSVTVLRMEVPCCKGIENAVMNAVDMSGKKVPVEVFTITTDGCIKL